MKTPLLLLKVVAKALLNTIGAGIAGDLIAEVLPGVVEDVWEKWCKQGDERQRLVEIQALVQSSSAEIHSAVSVIIEEVACDKPETVRIALETNLSRLPKAIRKSLRRPNDPTGTTISKEQSLSSAADLLSLLTARGRLLKKSSRNRTSLAHADRITLRVVAGPHKGKRFSFAGHDTFLVGRSKGAHFRLPTKDRFFSRVHFMVEVNPPQCRLLDMGSRNGTYVNKKRVEGFVELRDGDRIRAGHTRMKVAVKLRQQSSAAQSQRTVEFADGSEKRKQKTKATPITFSKAPTNWTGPTCVSCGVVLEADGKICPSCVERSAAMKQEIPGYQLIRELGRGGMGVVYLAQRSADESLVALKMIIPAVAGSKKQIARFLREASILQQLKHRSIVAFREMGESDGMVYFAMDFIRGTDAGRILKINGPLPVDRAVRLTCQMLEALGYAHEKGFVHRDIKPANLLVCEQQGREAAQLADFGLARVYQASQLSGLTVTGDIGGTVAFMAPEQITQYRDSPPSVDQYSAAAALYNMLTCKHVFDLPREPHQRLLMIMHKEPVPIQDRRGELPDALAQVIHRALAKSPEDRFTNAMEFRQALLPFRKA